jgi:hypothetical protein
MYAVKYQIWGGGGGTLLQMCVRAHTHTHTHTHYWECSTGAYMCSVICLIAIKIITLIQLTTSPINAVHRYMLCCYQSVYTPFRCAIKVTTKDIWHPSTLLLKYDNSKCYLSFVITINTKVPSNRKGQDSSDVTAAGYGLVGHSLITGRHFSVPRALSPSCKSAKMWIRSLTSI